MVRIVATFKHNTGVVEQADTSLPDQIANQNIWLASSTTGSVKIPWYPFLPSYVMYYNEPH